MKNVATGQANMAVFAVRELQGKRLMKQGARQGLVVVGMHRSGTSAMTGVLARMGVDLPKRLLPPAADNPTGFWEAADVVEFNDRVLAKHQSAWDHISDVSLDIAPGERETLIIDATDLLHQQFADSSLFALKDPRLSRLWSIWGPALGRAHIQPIIVHMVRHPTEVIGSLMVRNRLCHTDARALWLDYNFQAERDTRGAKRLIVTYEQLLSDWCAVVARVRALGVAFPRSVEDAAPDMQAFLSEGLRHHKLARAPAEGALVGALYDAFTQESEADEPGGDAQWGTTTKTIDAAYELFAPVLRKKDTALAGLGHDINRAREELTAVREELATARLELVAAQNEVANLRRSLSAADDELQARNAHFHVLEARLSACARVVQLGGGLIPALREMWSYTRRFLFGARHDPLLELTTRMDAAPLSLDGAVDVLSLSFRPDLDLQAYASSNPDVRAAGVNALVHFVAFGKDEGRAPPWR